MPKFSEQKILPYTPDQIYALVADVARYPEFLPWCLAAEILNRQHNCFTARLDIGWRRLRENFISRVELSPQKSVIVTGVEGPFRYLTNHWYFAPYGNAGCMVDFAVDFEFRSPLLRTVMQPLFFPAVQKMMAAFTARAAQLYG